MPEQDFDAAAKEIASVFRRYRLDYNQTKHVVKKAREKCRLSAPKSKRGSVSRLTAEEQEAIVEQAYRTEGQRGLMMQFLLETGLRVSEFVNVRIEDISFTDRLVTVEEEGAKFDKRREVPITRDMVQLIRLHLGDRRDGYLFESRRNDRYSPRRVQEIVKEIAAEAGITKRVYPHLLRHTMAKRLRDRGVPVDVIKEIMGHESVQTTERYYGTSAGRVREAFDEAMGESGSRNR